MDWVQIIDILERELNLENQRGGLARILGLRSGIISDIKKGKAKNPGSNIALLLINKLNVNPEWLEFGTEPIFLDRLGNEPADYQHKPVASKETNLSLTNISNQKNQAKTATHHTPLPVVHEVSDGIVIPLLEQPVSAGNGKDLREDNLPALYLNIPSKYGKYGYLYALPVRGDSMYPTLDEGDLVVCDSGGWDGDGIYVIKSQECAFVKRVTLSSKGYTVISDNEAYPAYSESKEDIAIVGKVRCAVVRFK